MTEEPVYNFVKGKGWVASSGYTATAQIGKWVVTVEQRTPKRGERYIELWGTDENPKPETVEEALEALKGTGFTYCMGSDYVRDYFNKWRKYNERVDYTESSIFVISFAKPKVERAPRQRRVQTLEEALRVTTTRARARRR